jgi:hypothetical protein
MNFEVYFDALRKKVAGAPINFDKKVARTAPLLVETFSMNFYFRPH